MSGMGRGTYLLAWATDTHFDMATPDAVDAFVSELRELSPDGLLITGDVATALTLEQSLIELAEILAMPVYFVLGNHDSYGGSISETRSLAERLNEHEYLYWLPAAGRIALAPGVSMVGHGGWADGRNGIGVDKSHVQMNDFVEILELSIAQRKGEMADTLSELGDESAAAVEALIRDSYELGDRHVLVATHVPPFAESAWHEGALSDAEHLPHFSNSAMGDMLRSIAHELPDLSVTVCCGHTHSSGVFAPSEVNGLVVHTGAAHYRQPGLAGFFDVDTDLIRGQRVR